MKTCPFCHNSVDKNNNYCTTCGEKMSLTNRKLIKKSINTAFNIVAVITTVIFLAVYCFLFTFLFLPVVFSSHFPFIETCYLAMNLSFIPFIFSFIFSFIRYLISRKSGLIKFNLIVLLFHIFIFIYRYFTI